jgi:hypothetical protein
MASTPVGVARGASWSPLTRGRRSGARVGRDGVGACNATMARGDAPGSVWAMPRVCTGGEPSATGRVSPQGS